MDSPLSTLGFVIFGITFSIYCVIAESQSRSLPPPRSPPPSPLPTPPSHLSPPPPVTSPPLPHPSPSPPPPTHAVSPPPPPPPHFSSPHNHALHRSPRNQGTKANRSPANGNHSRHRSPPLPPSHRMNGGKKIGLLFAGIAGIMQIGVIGFLVFKRRQLLRTKDAFEAGA